jgi:hypothetical protein
MKKAKKSRAFKFVLIIGIMSFFADFTYEGSRGIIGPYLALLGASAFSVAFITGIGEFIGYAWRLVSGSAFSCCQGDGIWLGIWFTRST